MCVLNGKLHLLKMFIKYQQSYQQDLEVRLCGVSLVLVERECTAFCNAVQNDKYSDFTVKKKTKKQNIAMRPTHGARSKFFLCHSRI